MMKTSANVVPSLREFTAEAPVVTGISAELAAEWKVLSEAASEPNAFGECWFVDSALRLLRGDETVRLAQVRDSDGILIGTMPLAISPRHGRLPVANIGNWIHLQCYCGIPLIRAGDECAFWIALLDLLDRSQWATGFLSLRLIYANGPVMLGLEDAVKVSRRNLGIAEQYDRATLASKSDPAAYIETTIRPKKRKELRRQAKRLAEQGTVAFERLAADGNVAGWSEQYLALENSGWKGKGGTALAMKDEWSLFFRESMACAHALGKLDFLRLTLDGRAIAMLVNLRAPPAVWSYKITFDESLARFSPGVLIEIEAIPLLLRDPQIDWADSCAKPGHPMINSLWGERQSIVHVTVSLKGPVRQLTYLGCRSFDALGNLVRRNGTQNDD